MNQENLSKKNGIAAGLKKFSIATTPPKANKAFNEHFDALSLYHVLKYMSSENRER